MKSAVIGMRWIGPRIKTNSTSEVDKRKQFNYTKVNIVFFYVIAI